jgi:signal transduction histidine kinase
MATGNSAPLSTRPGRGVRRKLFVVFALQVAAISAAVILGVSASAWVLKDMLIQEALTQEAALYADRLDIDPRAAPPDTVNLKGFFQYDESVPVPGFLTGLPDGFHDLKSPEEGSIGYVETRADGKLFLVFKEQQVMKLALYFGLVPLVLILLAIYLTAWLTYRLSHQAVSPLVALARRVEQLDFDRLEDNVFDPDVVVKDPDQEVLVLASALQQLNERIQRFVGRERDFTRDASHELRTPVTVIQMASGMLLEEGELGEYETRTVQRIQTVAKDMQALIEALLVLARESGEGLPTRDIEVNEVVQDEVQRYGFLVSHKEVELRLIEDVQLRIHGSPSALSVMVGNLIRNACAYTTEGEVRVVVGRGFVSVDDTGVGMSDEVLEQAHQPYFRGERSGKGGHGVGLTIVNRMADRFSWPVDIQSRLGVGTQATIYFPDSELVDEEPAATNSIANGETRGPIAN